MAAGIYIHIPFCKSRCSYCDFATDVYRDAKTVERYVDALCTEIRRSGSRRSVEADTIYLGGGTPSLLTPLQVERILETVKSHFSVKSDAEITMEMNPATVTPRSLAAYRQLGINRASFGVQTFDDRALRLLARGHNAKDARDTFATLRGAGFDNVSFDLIGGLPGQTLNDWNSNLEQAIRMFPEHISLYLLEVHTGTPLAAQISSGRQPKPEDDAAAEMYEVTLDRLFSAGYEQYEISNFCLPGFRSRHNTKYWMLEPVYGFGVSAHSFDGRQRYANDRDTVRYVDLIESESSAEVMREDIDLPGEAAFLGLRMDDGLGLAEYKMKFGIDLIAEYGDEASTMIDAGLIEVNNDRMRLTRRGKLLSNEVFAVFV